MRKVKKISENMIRLRASRGILIEKNDNDERIKAGIKTMFSMWPYMK